MHSTFQEILFLVLASVSVLSALMVILFTNPVRCVLSLVLTFIATSGLWILAHAEFLGLILVLVYVGAVMTLFLFVVMMLDMEKNPEKRYFKRYIPFGLIIVAFLVALMMVAIKPENFGFLPAVAPSSSNTLSIGMVLYTNYAYAVEIAAVLLIIAIVSAIILAHRPPHNNTRVQKIFDQLAVRKTDRLRIVKVTNGVNNGKASNDSEKKI